MSKEFASIFNREFDKSHATEKSTLDIRPKQFGRWVTHLPWADPAATGRQLLQALRTMNATHYPVNDRMAALEIIRPGVHTLTQIIQQRLCGVCPPLSKKSAVGLNTVKDLETQLAHGYQRALKTLLNNPAHRGTDTTTVCLQRIMRHHGNAQQMTYLVYARATENFWRDLHHLFKLADRQKLLDRPVTDCTLDRNKPTSIRLAYLQLLLAAKADPYQLQQSEIDKLHLVLQHWSNLVHITAYQTSTPSDCFNVDFRQDRAVASKISRINAKNAIMVDCSQLVKFIEQRILSGRLAIETQKGQLALAENFLVRLLTTFSVAHKRRFSRSSRCEQTLLALGINEIHRLLTTDIENLLPTAPAVGTTNKKISPPKSWTLSPLNPDLGTISSIQTVSQSISGDYSEHQKAFPNWQIVDESAGGCRLLWQYPHSSKARVGDVVALKDNTTASAKASILALVCWLQQVENYGLLMGLKLLAPKFEPVKLSQTNMSQHTEDNIQNGLMLPELANINQPAILITSAHTYPVNGNVSAKRNHQQSHLKLNKLIADTGIITQFQFIVLNTTEKATQQAGKDAQLAPANRSLSGS